MSARRLHNLTAVCLAVLYGTVGLTGDSIHYLAAYGWRGIVARSHDDTTVYYHVHGPDFHGHYHRHVHRHHQQAIARTTNSDKVGKSLLGVVFKTSKSRHKPHACPALALVSVLKLIHASHRCPRINFDSVVSPVREVTHIAAFEVTLPLYARGPPAVNFA